jgi:uncharacterized protein (TIGR00299 family) protein
MICGALLDAGGDAQALERTLRALNLGPWTLRLESVRRGALQALHFGVHEEPSHHDHRHPHFHRAWSDIRATIEAAELPPRAKRRALQVFERLAQVESRAHGVPVDDVAFHEVGALDSIIDIVGACVLLEQLDVDRIVATPLPLGSGTVQTAHGPLPVPVPAVIGLLTGWPTVQDGRTGELVTPTGAALVTTLAEPGPMPSMTPSASGIGAGSRNPPERANVVRVVLGNTDPAASTDQVHVFEAQVDDMPGEWVPPLVDALFAAGALDAWAAPVLMKKGRPGLLVSAMARPENADAVSQAMLLHATTFGVRHYTAQRHILERHWDPVETSYGSIRVKIGRWRGEVVQVAPEYEDVAVAAKTFQVSVATVHRAALVSWENR